MWKKIFGGGKTAREEKAPADQNPLYDRINWQRLPRHVAIIMDGNGRWAQGKGLIRTAGHKAGVKTLKNILKAAIDLRIEALTVYAFSTENWKRPRPEVEFLMKLFSEYLIKELEEMNDYNVRIRFMRSRSRASPFAIVMGMAHKRPITCRYRSSSRSQPAAR